MTPTVAGWGVALPGAITQDALWEGFFHHHFLPREVARRIFAASGVRRRHAVANPLAEDLSRWSTSRRMRRFAEEAHPLGHRAVTLAMTDAGTGADEIGLLAVASCTGYGTPGLDIRLAAPLDLPPDIQRVLIGHMGCYAALPALRSVAVLGSLPSHAPGDVQRRGGARASIWPGARPACGAGAGGKTVDAMRADSGGVQLDGPRGGRPDARGRQAAHSARPAPPPSPQSQPASP